MRVLKHIILFTFLAALAVGGAPAFVPDELIVRFEDGLSGDDVDIILLDQPILTKHQISRPLNIWLLKIDLNLDQLHLVKEQIQKQAQVPYVQFNHYLSERNTPNDPLYVDQWSFNNTGQSGGVVDADIDAPEAWEITTGGENAMGYPIVAAIVDGGCDLSHPDLMNNLWSNPLDSANNGIDDDMNGWVDDTLGWNAFGHNGTIPTSSHGTHVAGTVGARTNNDNQVAGINWDINLMIIAGASTTTSVTIEGYSYVLEQKLAWIESFGESGAFVVSTNSSFGIDFADCESDDYPVWNDMYNAMGEAGILSVAATANRNTNVDALGDVPTGCSSPYLVTVTNTTRNDVKASAGYGLESIDLGAPGSSILSTNWYQGTSFKTGTSMSAPHVTGAIALMHAAANLELVMLYEEDPALGASIFKYLLLGAADPLTDLEGITKTGGRLNLHKAVLSAQGWLPLGDGNMNGDAYVNIQDLIILTQLILGQVEPTSNLLETGDLNGDDLVTVQDVIRLVNQILN